MSIRGILPQLDHAILWLPVQCVAPLAVQVEVVMDALLLLLLIVVVMSLLVVVVASLVVLEVVGPLGVVRCKTLV